ncbi:shikimate dehydrogenase [Stappia sp. F7233]|uniref:Shikimate dehydrogenase n=1 Tax=Stappia albiluteola TaxID=2758565 RepID=A0A839ADX4_9HYPH|nr:shikimate dehydrogenase [Stappia albiluteola]MBA5777112.1 shikimate dehydrogenase [Stappia albiluteola]
MDRNLRLGLIGDNIRQTRSPSLHIVCGLASGINVAYDLLIPYEQGLPFHALLKRCEEAGYNGLNVTYPYKETAAKLVTPGDPMISRIGSSNTICFRPEGPRCFNTDYTGFVSAYRDRFGATEPGRVLLIGAGGVGRAVAFGLLNLGCGRLDICDSDADKIAALSSALRGGGEEPAMQVGQDSPKDLGNLDGYDGVINCTPLGMVGKPGSPLPPGVSGQVRWAFEAVYTPLRTTFIGQVEALGADVLNGYELYFHQGIQAFEHFSGVKLADPARVRDILLNSAN